ncbi:MAG: pyridoxamine 5'-phosphate oxidase family protein [Candidatus Schekmanbacteria bacterium]|nr:MAG: pyridoxamine 5'-phosphate oxidase family protein [Candidatus Schekmanbacteria bacterium]
MKRSSILLILCVIISTVFILFLGISETKGGIAEKTPAPIKADQVKPSGHPETKISMTCSECHEVEYDAESTATKTWIKNYAQLPKDELWKRIVAFLPYRQRFVMATVGSKGIWPFKKYYPTATTADFTLVPDERIIICSNEKGTEKLAELKKNPWVSMVHYEGSIEGPVPPKKRYWKSVQIFGKATMYESDDPEFDELAKKYHFYRIRSERAYKRMVMTKVDIKRIIYFDSTLMKEGYSPYQLWVNDKFKD